MSSSKVVGQQSQTKKYNNCIDGNNIYNIYITTALCIYMTFTLKVL